MHTYRQPMLLPLLLSLTLAVAPVRAQTELEPGFNLFSVEQDIEIGRQSAAEVEQKLPLLRDQRVEGYVARVGKRLERATPGPDYPYQFKLIDAEEVNAFALPGGFIYLHRGLLEAAGSEAELAGVMAHEMAHVALRHGTNQASKAYLAQAGFGILGGFLGSGTSSQIIGAVGGFGLNTLFLKFSRSAESKADVLGAQILADVGYDPMEMVRFFEQMEARADRDPGKFETFFSSHPPPRRRAERVREELRLIGEFPEREPVGDFQRFQQRVASLEPSGEDRPDRSRVGGGDVARIERPSTRFNRYRHPSGLYQIDYPDNWKVFEERRGFCVTVLPRGGVVSRSGGRQEVVYGVIVNHYRPFDADVGSDFQSPGGFSISLDDATEDLVHQLLRSNSYLQTSRRHWRHERLDGLRARSVVLQGISPVTGELEEVKLFTCLLSDDHVLYFLSVAPAFEYRRLGDAFQRMLSSLRVRHDSRMHP